MAGETSADLTIVVRAQDAATRVITGIGKTVGRILTAPLRGVVKAVGDITKQFFGLKGVLVGGGIIAAVRGLTDGLSTSEKSFKAVFSPEVQSRINAIDDAFGRLGASLKATFGNIVAEFALDEKLNSVSDWLRDNQATIIQGFRDVGSAIATTATTIVDLIKSVEKFFSTADAVTHTQKFSDRDLEIINRSRRASGDPLLSPEFRTTELFGPPIPPEAEADWSGFADKFWEAKAGASAATSAVQDAAKATATLTEAQSQAAPIVEEVTAAVKDRAVAAQAVAAEDEKVAEVIKGYLTVAEAADLVASNMTDAFYDMVTGAESVGRAFGRMVQTIIGELGKLLLYRSLINLLTSLGTSLFTAKAPTGGGAFTSESGFGGLTSTAFAAGGKVRRHTFARVGENGPENVLLPAGSSVEPAHRSRGGDGGSVVNVYGARDPKATALEVMAQMRLRPALRAALR